MGNPTVIDRTLAIKLSCVSITPFGSPVVPEVVGLPLGAQLIESARIVGQNFRAARLYRFQAGCAFQPLRAFSIKDDDLFKLLYLLEALPRMFQNSAAGDHQSARA